jgi:hypothetical protein
MQSDSKRLNPYDIRKGSYLRFCNEKESMSIL